MTKSRKLIHFPGQEFAIHSSPLVSKKKVYILIRTLVNQIASTELSAKRIASTELSKKE